MSYSITVQADTKQECLDMLATLLRASGGDSQPVVQVTHEEKQALLEVLTPSETVTANMAAAEKAPALSPAEMRVRLRTLLTPYMKTDAANDVRALLKKHGTGGLSEVPDENLAALLTEAMEVLQ